MDLHHTSGTPDWASVAPDARNSWQRAAAATRGVLTPANIISVLGFVLVVAGSTALKSKQFEVAFWLVAVGRLCDLADGYAAQKTGTKSPLGESVDAVLDKLGLLAVLLALGSGHIAAWWIVGIIALQNAANSVIAYIGRRRRLGIQPTGLGKLATVFEWLALFCFILGRAYGPAWNVVGYCSLVPALGLGAFATVGYGLHVFPRRHVALQTAKRTRG
ncbi:MAG TPA: CDP-alcohol phosphatidyltransferase family protein [Candidatus Saccharimonadales bacterium]|nr:CDP-alcohol phosphatidyltransferase family protein [Candidatus Saccharimonadales bacterium]